MASVHGRRDVVELLLENGADVNMADKNQIGPLYAAAQRGSMDIVKMLVDNGANLEPSNGELRAGLPTRYRRFRAQVLSGGGRRPVGSVLR